MLSWPNQHFMNVNNTISLLESIGSKVFRNKVHDPPLSPRQETNVEICKNTPNGGLTYVVVSASCGAVILSTND